MWPAFGQRKHWQEFPRVFIYRPAKHSGRVKEVCLYLRRGDVVIEVLIFAGIALFVLAQLYAALGKGGNNRPAERPAISPGPERVASELAQRQERKARGEKPIFTGPAAAGLEDIYNADNDFSESGFLQGAKSAYQMIVAAFARGDRAALRPLLDTDVFEAWDAAIADRETRKEAPFELLRIRRAEIDRAELDGRTARIGVRYEADLGDGEATRTAREIWIFKRNVDAQDPDWLLDEVETAS
jgi:predicted lipid-binding transport protein (Tim44 family)